MAYNKRNVLLGLAIITLLAVVSVKYFTRRKSSRDKISEEEKEQLLQVVEDYIEGNGLPEFDLRQEKDVPEVLRFCANKCLAEHAGVGEGIQKIGIPLETVTEYATEHFAVSADCDVAAYFPKNYSQSLYYAEDGVLYGFWDYGRIVYNRAPLRYILWFIEKTARGYTIIGANCDSPIYYQTDTRPLGNPAPCNFWAEIVYGDHGQLVLQSFRSNIIRQKRVFDK